MTSLRNPLASARRKADLAKTNGSAGAASDHSLRRRRWTPLPTVSLVTSRRSIIATFSPPVFTKIVQPPSVRHKNSGLTTRCLEPSARRIVNGLNGLARCSASSCSIVIASASGLRTGHRLHPEQMLFAADQQAAADGDRRGDDPLAHFVLGQQLEAVDRSRGRRTQCRLSRVA